MHPPRRPVLLLSLRYRCVAPPRSVRAGELSVRLDDDMAMNQPLITVYFDYASPFAYIASEVLPEFAARHGVALQWRPIELGALSNYAHGLPYSPVKSAYVLVDAPRTAQFHRVPIQPPKLFPVQSGLALRLALVAQAYGHFDQFHHAVFRAAWRDGQDIGSEPVLLACTAQADAAAAQWLQEAQRSDASEKLATLTAEAEAAGVFGVPSMLLDGELFWGVDSLPVLAWRLKQQEAAI